MRKIKVLIRGPALSASGYGEHCRFLLRALKRSDNVDIYLDNIKWGNLGYQPDETKERREIFNLVNKTKLAFARGGLELDASIQVSIPNEFQKIAKYNIGVTAGIEVDRISPVWIEKCNIMDKVITISEHSKSGFTSSKNEVINQSTGEIINTKVAVPVSVVPYPVPTTELCDINLDLDTSFNFIVFALWGERKNLPNTINWFIEEFRDDPDVGLIVKTCLRSGCTIDKQMTNATLRGILRNHPDMKCKVYLLHGRLHDDERNSLFSHEDIKSLVTLSHGEGFGLPIFEAACAGLPIVAPNWGGQKDFLNHHIVDKKGKSKKKSLFTKVEYDLAPVSQTAAWEGVIESGSKWCYPKKNSYKTKIREVYKNYEMKKSIAKNLQSHVLDKYESGKIHDLFLKEVMDTLSPLIQTNEQMEDEVSRMFSSLKGE